MKIYSDITKTIGQTPLIEMQRVGKGLPGKLVLKLEFFNPLSSVKDRIGKAMIEDAEKNGLLKPGMEILEPTSGNTGIALAFIAAAKGYPITLVMPETMSQERRTLLLLLGAKIILTPGVLGMKGAIAKAMELSEKNKNAWMPSQFDNQSNPKIHRETTGPEIWEDTDGNVDIVVSGVGTSGTITGAGQFLKSKKSTIQMIAVEPAESPVLSGGKPGPHKIQGLGAGFIPSVMDKSIMDGVEQVSSEESLKTAKDIIKLEGIPVGISSGAAVAAGLRIAAKPENQGKLIVVVIPSSTERYLSTLLAEQERQEAQNLSVSTVEESYLSRVK
ncbi:cysteine synthase A [Bdellovibrio reynosensis]|uniref:cysteine synthase n=1 Tax=Bdellovibrio reynosensis TaxID=2835041 RepID=A0ABY4CEA5_9BACT|nr:cysteine synthase A [Bdellovibrio reynosensis]UOF02222.1 cysteine synthase A [Bdellovibrio reynosensis]